MMKFSSIEKKKKDIRERKTKLRREKKKDD